MSPFKRNLLIGYGFSLLLLIITAVASYISISSLLDSIKLVNHTNETILELNNMLRAIREGEAGQRGYLLTNDDRFLIPFTDSRSQAQSSFDRVKALTIENPDQAPNMIVAQQLLDQRFGVMDRVIEETKSKGKVDHVGLESGRQIMEELSVVMAKIERGEKRLLAERTDSMLQFASITPVLIVSASCLAIFITGLSFYRVMRDFEQRAELQNQLQEKDRQITSRLNIVKNVSGRIAQGDYAVRVDDKGQDELSEIAGSLNKMASSLEISFTDLSNRNWIQKGISVLNDKMLGQKDVGLLGQNILNHICDYTESNAGALYLANDAQNALVLLASYAGDNKARSSIPFGEGVIGQAARSGKQVLLQGLEAAQVEIPFSAGVLKPKCLVATPIYYEGRLIAVIELACLENYDATRIEFLQNAGFNIGTALNSAMDHRRLQELLEETEEQATELQSQRNELENINAELEAQAGKLQASEEELRVQQEELQQVNQEMEERNKLLEEKNALILERNFEIQQKSEELTLSTRYKSEFLANMSHELRTPLNSILLLSKLLADNNPRNLSTDQIEYATVIQSSGKTLLTLIDEILDLSKIEAGKMELEYGTVRISDITDGLNALFSPIAKEKGIDFDVNVSPDVPLTVEIDRLRVEQVLRNLISNAVKFTKQGSVKLILENDAESKRIAFRVKDTGIGIPREKQTIVFEAFQQADGSTRRQYGGTGLGLSISKEIASLLSGEIIVESEEGRGSEFTFILPTARADAEQIKQRRSQTPRPADEPKPVATQPQPIIEEPELPKTPGEVADDREEISDGDRVILIVEDDVNFARALVQVAHRRNYKVVVSVRGDDVLPLARHFKPFGILLDVKLPGKNGWEVMDELKANPATKGIPVYMMSSESAKKKSISKGAIDFIDKPVSIEQMGAVFSKLEAALRRNPKKVLIVEENSQHAQALAYFLETCNVSAEIQKSVSNGIMALNRDEVNCVILDMGIPAHQSFEILDEVKKTKGLEELPIIVFTGRHLSQPEEMRLKQYADSIVVKTAHSYQRILDEVSLFLHLVEENVKGQSPAITRRLGALDEVLKDKTILVVDDDVRNIFSLGRALEVYNVKVVSAMDGKEAIHQLQSRGDIDLVLMDMMMPEMDGYEAMTRIRKIPAFKHLPILAVTAKAMSADREKCITAGASDYITKPVDVQQLVSLLRVWLYNKI